MFKSNKKPQPERVSDQVRPAQVARLVSLMKEKAFEEELIVEHPWTKTEFERVSAALESAIRNSSLAEIALARKRA